MTVTTSASGKEATKGSAPIVIVSCDTHIGPRLMEDLRPYCPQNLLQAFDDYAGGLKKKREAAAANKEKVSFGGNSVGPDWGVRFANLETPGHYDMHARLRDLDNDGVAAEVMFHDSQNGEPIPFQLDTLLMRRDRTRSGLRAPPCGSAHLQPMARRRVFHRTRTPHRFDAPAHVGHGGGARRTAVGPVGRAQGAQLPVPEALHAALQRSRWDTFFSACEDLGVTLCNHGGAGASGGTYPGAMSIAKYELSMMTRICPMDQLVFGGVFERHPRLRAGHHGVARIVVGVRAEGDGQHLPHRHQ